MLIGIVTIKCLITEPQVSRVYIKDARGKVKRIKVNKEGDEQSAPESDDGAPFDEKVLDKKKTVHFGEFVEGFALTAWGKIKLLTGRIRDTLRSCDLMLYFVLLASFTSEMATDSITVIYIWFKHWEPDHISKHERVVISIE